MIDTFYMQSRCIIVSQVLVVKKFVSDRHDSVFQLKLNETMKNAVPVNIEFDSLPDFSAISDVISQLQLRACNTPGLKHFR